MATITEDIVMLNERWVSSFGNTRGGGRDLLGGKGAELAEMTSIGLPVPPGFTVSTAACREYYSSGKTMPVGLEDEVRASIDALEAETGRTFGDPTNPLLVSVRSGAAVSMPGMMDTILDLGINSSVAKGMAARTANESFALDLHRRFIQMYGNVVLGVDDSRFNGLVQRREREQGVERATDLPAADLLDIVDRFKAVVEDASGESVPDDPWDQLMRSIQAVLESWNTHRAVSYREYYDLIGHVGGEEDLPQPTLSRGIVTRIRDWPAIEMTYFQADIRVEAGQSGGVLLSTRGEVIGVLGHVVTRDDYVLASSAIAVLQKVIEPIADADIFVSRNRLLPVSGGALIHDFDLDGSSRDAAFILNGPVGAEFEIVAESDSPHRLWLWDPYGRLVGRPRGTISGTVSIEGPYILTVGLESDAPTHFRLTSSLPLIQYIDPDDRPDISLPTIVHGIVDYPNDTDRLVMELEEGESVDLLIESVSYSPGLMVGFRGAPNHQQLRPRSTDPQSLAYNGKDGSPARRAASLCISPGAGLGKPSSVAPWPGCKPFRSRPDGQPATDSTSPQSRATPVARVPCCVSSRHPAHRNSRIGP